MVSFIAAPSTNFTIFHQSISYLSSPSPCFPINSLLKRGQLKKHKFSGFLGIVRMCKNWEWEEEGEADPTSTLELQLLEFMKNSKNPNKFPSRKELSDAGRLDLVQEIITRGGWMTMGWGPGGDEDNKFSEDGFDTQNGYSHNGAEGDANSDFCSSSGRPLIRMAAEDDTGIQGILNRLERQRNFNFGFKASKHKEYVNEQDYGHHSQIQDVDSCHLHTSETAFSRNGLNTLSDTWRTWSIQRSGFPDTEFEAGEIDFGQCANQDTVNKPMNDIVGVSTHISEAQHGTKYIDCNYRETTQGDLKARLQHLEVELLSALRSLRSNSIDLSGKAKEHLSEDLRQLSDVSEFQENEIMNAQDKLRSLRAKLAVIEGKMALAIVDAQNILDEKQKRINDARIALQLLRTTCIVWPNSGSEVLLAGSFDGWSTQRKMTRSSTGIFSLCLKLYPGKYEIKFIVDGIWKVDPLRPIVTNNGFENNLLIIN
ncbi:unnamed protein product [Amaranthus hypochondriacus]